MLLNRLVVIESKVRPFSWHLPLKEAIFLALIIGALVVFIASVLAVGKGTETHEHSTVFRFIGLKDESRVITGTAAAAKYRRCFVTGTHNFIGADYFLIFRGNPKNPNDPWDFSNMQKQEVADKKLFKDEVANDFAVFWASNYSGPLYIPEGFYTPKEISSINAWVEAYIQAGLASIRPTGVIEFFEHLVANSSFWGRGPDENGARLGVLQRGDSKLLAVFDLTNRVHNSQVNGSYAVVFGETNQPATWESFVVSADSGGPFVLGQDKVLDEIHGVVSRGGGGTLFKVGDWDLDGINDPISAITTFEADESGNNKGNYEQALIAVEEVCKKTMLVDVNFPQDELRWGGVKGTLSSGPNSWLDEMEQRYQLGSNGEINLNFVTNGIDNIEYLHDLVNESIVLIPEANEGFEFSHWSGFAPEFNNPELPGPGPNTEQCKCDVLPNVPDAVTKVIPSDPRVCVVEYKDVGFSTQNPLEYSDTERCRAWFKPIPKDRKDDGRRG